MYVRVAALPRNAMGKVNKKALLQTFEDELGSWPLN
jgi:hypothetical protein